MTRKASIKYKRKVSLLLRKAASNDMSLSLFASLLKQVSHIKKIEKDKKKFGEYLCWSEADSKSGLWLRVPIYSKKDNRPTGMTRIFFNNENAKEEIPAEYLHLLDDLRSIDALSSRVLDNSTNNVEEML